VLAAGALTTVQDSGRPGLASIGVGTSGACDRVAYDLANRLVGNAPGAAALETTLGGLAVSVRTGRWVALTGAPCPMTVNGAARASHTPVYVPAGGTLRLGVPATGLRSYLAVRGGIDAPVVLGSRASDTLTGIGPPVVRAGGVLAVGCGAGGPVPAVDIAPVAALPSPAELCVLPGPRLDWFAPGALERLAEAPYQVASDSNRVAVRLLGPSPQRVVTEELPSEGLVLGAVQCPPSGELVVFLADHPVTGGYPVLAVITAASVAAAAQARPGDTVRFRIARQP
jgi:biotin-dependent carboxylase-like uncharacterized protein